MKHRKMNRVYRWKNNGKGVFLKKHWKKIALISVLSLSLIAASAASGLAAGRGGQMMNGGFGGGMQGGMMGMNANVTYAENPSEIVTSSVENAAASLSADLENATYIQMSDSDSKVKIEEAGTYVISGDCSDGSITVKKGTTGVVLVLDSLSLSSSTGAAVSINKEAQAKIVISGSVTLTDNEEPADENSADTEMADAYDGAALKAKAGSQVYLTGDGTLTINGTAKNGIKVGDDDSSFVVDGDSLTVNITAANDGINAGADLTLLSGTVNITANDDAIHADRILTVGAQDAAAGPDITVSGAEGLEGTVINIFSGKVTVAATDDAINGTQKDDSLTASLNITGGTVNVQSRGDGLDCNGNINLLGGTITINSASFGGEAGIDFDGAYYVASSVILNNSCGVSGPDQGGFGGMRGAMGGQGFDRRGGWRVNADGQDAQENNPFAQPGQMPWQNGQTMTDGQQQGQTSPFGRHQRNGQMSGQPSIQNQQTDIITSSTQKKPGQ